MNELFNMIRTAKHAGDTAMLSALKRSERNPILAYPYIAKFCDMNDKNQTKVMSAIACIAALVISANKEAGQTGNFGKVMAKTLDKKDNKYPYQLLRIFEAQTAEQFCYHIISAVKFALNRNIGIDLYLLAQDMLDFIDRKKRLEVIDNWACAYFL